MSETNRNGLAKVLAFVEQGPKVSETDKNMARFILGGRGEQPEIDSFELGALRGDVPLSKGEAADKGEK